MRPQKTAGPDPEAPAVRILHKSPCCHGAQSSKVSLEITFQCQVDLRKAGVRAGAHGGAEVCVAVVLKSRSGDWKGMLGPPWK